MDEHKRRRSRDEATVEYFAGSEVLGRPRGVIADLQPPTRLHLHGMARDIIRLRHELRLEMEHLAERLAQEARRVEHGEPYNTLGIVQGHGSVIDRRAGELGSLTDHFHMLVGALFNRNSLDVAMEVPVAEKAPEAYDGVAVRAEKEPAPLGALAPGRWEACSVSEYDESGKEGQPVRVIGGIFHRWVEGSDAR